ncbi:MAG: hypothetical protein PHF29_00865 [Candidatus Riflebacteria bacterium]|nr:hypothetical protein [Candidatus Riflebacteria bacterium]
MRFTRKIKGLPSMLALGTLMLFASNFLNTSICDVAGKCGGALFAASSASSVYVSSRSVSGESKSLKRKSVSKKSSNYQKNDKTVVRDEIPPEWNWFSVPLKVSYESGRAELVPASEVKVPSAPVKARKTVAQKKASSAITELNQISDSAVRVDKTAKKRTNASFDLAFAKMNKLKNQRTEKDKKIVANLGVQDKPSSMVLMRKKIREICQKIDSQAAGVSSDINVDCVVVAAPVPVAPSVVPAVPAVIAPPRDMPFCAKNVDDSKPILSDDQMSFAAEIIPPMDLNEIIAIDDMVAIDSAPPPAGVVKVVEPVRKKVQGYNRYAPKKPEKIETLYRGLGSEYSPRINELVNERKDKIFGKN